MRPIEIVLWWEIRRIPYNLVVGATGAISLVLVFLFLTWSGELKPGEDLIEPLALIAAPFAVNFCYTAGWIVELMLWVIRKRDVRSGPILFVLGTGFSIIVVAIPSVIAGAAFLIRGVGRAAGFDWTVNEAMRSGILVGGVLGFAVGIALAFGISRLVKRIRLDSSKGH
jgi:hypothetical protein